MAQSAIAQPTADHVLNAPLEQLLAEFNVEVIDYPTVERGFKGATAVRPNGAVAFYLPTGRPRAEREIVARSMLGETLHVELPDLPDPFQLSAFDDNGEPHVVNPRPHRNQADEALRRVRGGQV